MKSVSMLKKSTSMSPDQQVKGIEATNTSKISKRQTEHMGDKIGQDKFL